ncbi:unnamed protein product [Pylaiella littoralis]
MICLFTAFFCGKILRLYFVCNFFVFISSVCLYVAIPSTLNASLHFSIPAGRIWTNQPWSAIKWRKALQFFFCCSPPPFCGSCLVVSAERAQNASLHFPPFRIELFFTRKIIAFH